MKGFFVLESSFKVGLESVRWEVKNVFWKTPSLADLFQLL